MLGVKTVSSKVMAGTKKKKKEKEKLTVTKCWRVEL